jgi:hypothetical protein
MRSGKHRAGEASRFKCVAAQALLVVLASCGGTPSETFDQTPRADPEIEPTPSPAPETEPNPEPAETPLPDPGCEPPPALQPGTAQTPRADAEAEQLALEATGAIVAPQQVYDRIICELARIRQAYPEVAQLVARPSWISENVLIGFDEQGAAEVRRGTYHAWDVLNERFGLAETELSGDLAALTFEGRFYSPLVAEAYATLPHVRYAEPNFTVGDGDDACLEIAGDTHFFVFVDGDGDCLAGCLENTYWGFAVDAEGRITALGSWTDNYESPPPEWLESSAACSAWL